MPPGPRCPSRSIGSMTDCVIGSGTSPLTAARSVAVARRALLVSGATETGTPGARPAPATGGGRLFHRPPQGVISRRATLDEAVFDLEAIDHEFLLFEDLATGSDAVVSRVEGGSYAVHYLDAWGTIASIPASKGLIR